MSAVFLFVSPAALDERTWSDWRRMTRSASWPPPGAGTRYGEAPLADRGGAGAGLDPLDRLEGAIAGSRFNPGVMRRLPEFARRVREAFDWGAVQGKVSAAAWALVSSRDGLVVATAVAVDLAADELAARLDHAEARRRFDAAAFGGRPAAGLSEAAGFARALGLPVTGAVIRPEATQLLCLVETPDAPPTPLTHIHEEEEGDAHNAADELELAPALASYLHVGFSYTTAMGSTLRTLLLLAPLAIKTQALWFMQRELRTRILAIDFDRVRQERRETAGLLLAFQQLRFELHLWDSEIEAYRNALVPWQARVFDRYVAGWGMRENHVRLTGLVDHVCDLLRSSAERFDSRLRARQADILAVIGIIQLVGIASSVSGYFDLAALSHAHVRTVARTPEFAAFVYLLPAVTGIVIIALIAAARHRRW